MTTVHQTILEILPRDVLFSLLLRFQRKTLVKLRCVSKQWLDLISDPFFINLHFSKSKTKPLKLEVQYKLRSREYCEYKITIKNPLDPSLIEQFSLSFPAENYNIMYGSGLLLFYRANVYVHVCNPSTREVSTMSHNLTSKIKASFPDKCIFTAQNIFTGFGFVSTTSQHKIIEVFAIRNYEGEEWIFKACTTTLSNKNTSGSWKFISVNSDCSKHMRCCSWGSTICVNGMISKKSVYNDRTGDKLLRKILTFDLEAEQFRMLTCPFPNINSDAFLVDFNGSVCLVDVTCLGRVSGVWVLKDYKNEIWAKEYTINFTHKLDGWPLDPLILVDGNDEKTIRIEMGRGIFYHYDLRHKTFRKVWEYSVRYAFQSIHYDSIIPSCGLMMPITL